MRYKAQRPIGAGRYSSGQRRCHLCEIFIKWEGLWCPCCGSRLRVKPRNLKYKAKLRARVESDSTLDSSHWGFLARRNIVQVTNDGFDIDSSEMEMNRRYLFTYDDSKYEIYKNKENRVILSEVG
ncbi:hypothetical protein [Nitrosopumilus sp. b1]|uniref:hypothetical protein n=1 Tax=Nitrosopumilus sp. b1 TaxID=2109907 RepID=UPI00210731A8|nr:hypothetical protein [Nitrosopumilus sp. b1]